ncbi:MAG: hypothetical protein LQ344_002534 [Seirophora lacunosa]|nr:MAG: hypothetical protein LQ344_002534 [Seirophora lacunosa]
MDQPSTAAQEAAAPVRLPRITIQFCTQCKWMLRCAWYAQELLSTFSTSIGEVALVPATGGVFVVNIVHSTSYSTNQPGLKDTLEAPDGSFKTQTTQLWDRKKEGGFPEIKQLKKLVRDIIDPGRDLGHVDGRPRSEPSTAPVASPSQAQAQGQAPAASPSVTQQAEIMVADIMSALPKELTRNGGEDRARDQGTPAETSASKRAENMVADIMTSFREGVRKKDSVAAIGGGSGGLGTGEEGSDGDEVGTGKQGGTHSARRACDDCQ